MDAYVIAVGSPDTVKAVIGDLVHVEEDDTVIFSAPVPEQQALMKQLQSRGIATYTYAQYQKIIRTPMRFIPLKACNTATVYDWQKTGLEYFGMAYSDEFDICSIDKKDVAVVNKVEPVLDGYFSSTGAVIGFIRGNVVSLHVNDSLDKLFDVKTDVKASRLMFGAEDRHLAVCFPSHVDLYDILDGRLLYRAAGTECCFGDGRVYFEKGDFLLGQGVFEPSEGRSKAAAGGQKIGRFVDGKLQKIIFTDGSSTQVKNHNSISDVAFYFSESKMYVLITKTINGKQQYIFESYSGKEITINKLDSSPVSISVEDNSFVIYDTRHNLTFYKKERYNYVPVKTVTKDGLAIVSVRGSMACVYDSSSQTVEFYDRLALRSVYAHYGCTSIAWSESGLYVAVFSDVDAPTSLLQIFNCNGKLMYRKTYNRITSFRWRQFIKLTPEQRASMEPFPGEMVEEDSSGAGLDVATLLSEWKGYLLAKIQSNQEYCLHSGI